MGVGPAVVVGGLAASRVRRRVSRVEELGVAAALAKFLELGGRGVDGVRVGARQCEGKSKGGAG